MSEEPLKPICEAWLRQIDGALEHKKANFQKMADLAMRFFDGPYDFIYESGFRSDGGQPMSVSGSVKHIPLPAIKMSLNRVAEMIQLFGPFLYHKNPHRQANPRQMPAFPQEMLYLLAQQQVGLSGMGVPMTPPPMGGMMPPGMGPGMNMGMGMPPMPGAPPPMPPPGMPPGMPGPMMPPPGPGLPPAPMPMDPLGMAPVSPMGPGDPMGMGMMPPDPAMLVMMQQDQQRQAQAALDSTRSMLMDAVLNYTPNELGLKDHSRRAIDEAIIKGKGILWPEIVTTGNGKKLVGSFFKSVDDLVIDPDMEAENEAMYIALRCIHPIWQVERDYKLPPGTIEANMESQFSQQHRPFSDQPHRDRKGTNDLLEYWKVYSRMGCGARMAGMKQGAANLMEAFGDHVYLVVARGVPWPLNLPMYPGADMMPEDAASAVQWPIPFHADPTNPWPYVGIEFHPRPRKVWPQSHLQPAVGELLFLNWAYSYLATKIATTSRDLLAVAAGLEAEARRTLESGDNLAILEMSKAAGFENISQMVQFIQHPPMNKDIWDVIQAVENNFERRTGLSELIYGDSTRGMRSAEEAALKGEQIKIRPDDMASRVEEAMTLLARKEAIAWHLLSGADVEPIVGKEGATLWDQVIGPLKPETALEFEYRIEADSIRKPNRERDVANMAQVVQTILPMYFQIGMTSGNMGPFNAVIEDWCKAMDKDASKYMLPDAPMPPPLPPGSEQEGPPPPAGPPA